MNSSNLQCSVEYFERNRKRILIIKSFLLKMTSFSFIILFSSNILVSEPPFIKHFLNWLINYSILRIFPCLVDLYKHTESMNLWLSWQFKAKQMVIKGIYSFLITFYLRISKTLENLKIEISVALALHLLEKKDFPLFYQRLFFPTFLFVLKAPLICI